jgi:predicted signal transduction protein with EAL and GGDEF domain
MDVIAEGVETMEQAKSLIAMRCSHAQGSLFSRPLESESAEALLADDPGRIASSLPLPGEKETDGFECKTASPDPAAFRKEG